jgi:pyruvate carboxylase
MIRALGDFRIDGVPTTIPFDLRALASPNFRSGGATTTFIDEHPDVLPEPAPAPGAELDGEPAPQSASLLIEVDARELRAGSFSLLIDHRSYAIDVRRDGDRCRVDIGGRTIDVTLVDTLRHGGVTLDADAAEGPQEIRAMMPGKIVTVLVAAGDEVQKDQGILVVEAMKMENEVKAAGAGVVKEILVKPGQAVEAGEILARVE